MATFVMGSRLVELEVECQDIYAWLTEKSELPSFRVSCDQLPDCIFAHAPLTRHARNLKLRSGGGDIRIEAGRRCCEQVMGTGLPGFSACNLGRSCLNRSTSFWLVGPRLEPPEFAAS